MDRRSTGGGCGQGLPPGPGERVSSPPARPKTLDCRSVEACGRTGEKIAWGRNEPSHRRFRPRPGRELKARHLAARVFGDGQMISRAHASNGRTSRSARATTAPARAIQRSAHSTVSPIETVAIRTPAAAFRQGCHSPARAGPSGRGGRPSSRLGATPSPRSNRLPYSTEVRLRLRLPQGGCRESPSFSLSFGCRASLHFMRVAAPSPYCSSRRVIVIVFQLMTVVAL